MNIETERLIITDFTPAMAQAVRDNSLDEDNRREEDTMNATYEHKSELTFIVFHTEIAPVEGYQKCPEFRDGEYSETYARLRQTMKQWKQ